MVIGGSTRENRLPGEVYCCTGFAATTVAHFDPLQGPHVPLPYDSGFEIQKVAGGWIALMVDLARFAVAIACPDDTSPQNERLMRPFLSERNRGFDQIAAWPGHDLLRAYFPLDNDVQ